MSNHGLSKQLIVTGLAVLAFTSVAEAIIIYDFPIFGVVNGVQTARVNAVLQPPPDQDLSCPVTLGFIDSQGRSVGDPQMFQLRGGAAVGVDFIGNPDARVGQRLQIRARVAYGDPNEFPGCAAGVLTSVEVVDRLTGATHVILTNPVARTLR
jgi:hypothetical protein